MKKIILIDGNALVHRAFHALPPLTSPKGVVTNAVFGFSSILIKIIKEMKPDYIAAAFDLAGPTFRHEEFADYKIHRVKAPQELYDQIPLVKKTLSAFGVPVYEKQSFEADDLIGSLAEKSRHQKDLQVIIATGDLDTLQLVKDDKVVVFTLRKGVSDTVVYDQKAVMERYDLEPEQLSDYRGLKGDPSDNIPGVPGIGEKTASALIKEFGSLENLYQELEKSKDKEVKGVPSKLKEKLLGNKKQAFFSKQLSVIITNLDVDFSLAKSDWRKNLKLDEIERIFRDLGFASLLRRLPEIGLGSQRSINFDQPVIASKEMDQPEEEYQPGDKEIYLAPGRPPQSLTDKLSDEDLIVIGHDLKNSLKPLISAGEEIKAKIFDTKIAAYLLNPEQRSYDYEEVYYSEFRKTLSALAEKKTFELHRLKTKLWQKMNRDRTAEVFEKIEMPLVKILAEMELNGIKIDGKEISVLEKSVADELRKVEKKIFKLAGREFNINSPQQLGDVLFNKLKLKGKVRKTGGGALSTAAGELEKLREEHGIIDPILDYRELQKLKTTYIDPFPSLIGQDGRIRTTYNQTGAATGRLSSQDPNLQNIPIRTELGRQFRRSFVAEDGYQLVSFDYSQLELRIVAKVAGDKKMIDTFKRGEDIHATTAAEVFEVRPEGVTKEMRRQAKVLNFGIIYGMGSLAFARAAGVSRDRAREFMDKYFNKFSGVARYMEEMKKTAHYQGYVESYFGRRRPLLDINSSMPQLRAQSERIAINHPVQATAADLMKLAMIGVHNYIHKELKVGQDVRMLLQIHDELVFEIKKDKVKKVCPEIKKIMEEVSELDVPIVVEVKVGSNWANVEEFKIW